MNLFNTTGGLNHSQTLTSLIPNTYNYYVLCRDLSSLQNTSAEVNINFTIPLTPPGSGVIMPVVTVNRTSGVSPLAVFFDAADTTHSSQTVQPFHDLDYTWDFGDDPLATWSTTGDKKNTAKGAVAAHVFEQPGPYTVTLTVKDASGASTQWSQVITATAFSGTTYYVASGVDVQGNATGGVVGNDTNNGTSVSTPFQTYAKGIQTVFAVAGPRRVLFQRGDAFLNASSFSFSNKTGPYIIGAYGSGARPIIQTTIGIDPTVGLQPLGLSNTVSDVRVMDLHFLGPRGTGVPSGVAFGPGTDTLLLRSRLEKHSNGIVVSGTNKPNNFFVDSEFIDFYGNGIFYGGAIDYTYDGSLFVVWLDAEGLAIKTDKIGYVEGTTAWTQVQSRVTAPLRAVTARVQIYVSAINGNTPGTAWFDDLEFLDVSNGNTNLLSDPGFEQDGTGWKRIRRGGPFAVVTTPVHSGAKAMELTQSAPTVLPAEASKYQEIAVTARHDYAVSGWIQTNTLNGREGLTSSHIAVLGNFFDTFQSDEPLTRM